MKKLIALCFALLATSSAAGELGGELGAVFQPSGAEPVKVGAADLQKVAGLGYVNGAVVKLLQDLLEKQVSETFGDLFFS